MRRVAASLMLLIGLFIAWISGQQIIQQDRMQNGWVDHPARVDAFVIPGIANPAAREFGVGIQYTYTVDGKSYAANRFWPVGQTVDRAEAQRLQSQYSPGKAITVRIDPDHPAQAYVRPLYSGQPYWPLGLGVLFVAFGYGIASGLVGSTEHAMRLLPTDAGGWHELLPNQSLREKLQEAGFLTLSIAGPLAGASGWMLWIGKPLSAEAIWFPICAGLTAIGLLLWTVGRWRRVRRASDAKLHLRPAPIRRGPPIDLRVEIEAHRAIRSVTLRARIVCYRRIIFRSARRTMMQDVVRAEHTITLAENVPADAGKTVVGSADVQFDPAVWPATGREGVPMYPFFFWQIEIEFLADGRRSVAVFPVTAK